MRRNIAIAFALVIIISVASLTVLVYFDSRATLSAAILREYRAELITSELQVENTLDSAKKNVLALSGTPPVRGILRARRGGGYDAETQSSYVMWVARLQQIMASLLRNNPDYAQARFIDERGQERVRVDNLDGRPKILPSNALQNKAKSSYFTETMKLPSGGVYVSQLNLNREFGRIELPHRPMLRFATPVYDVFNRKSGMMVINVHADGLIRQVLASLQNLGGQAFLVNQDGYFLAHPDTTKSFGFDLNHDYRLDRIHPRLSENMPTTGTFVDIVIDEELPNVEPHVHGFHKIAFDSQNPGHYWTFVFEVPNSIALAPVLMQRNRLLVLGLTTALLGAITAFVWAGRITRPLKELTETANYIVKGHYHARVGLTGKRNEIHELSAAFNLMVDGLVNAERRFANIFEAAGDAIIGVDQDQRIVAFNNTAGNIFGYAPTDILGEPLERLLPEESASAHCNYIRAYGQEAGSTRIMGAGRNVAGRRQDGSIFAAEVSISKTIENGRSVFTAILRDITERKRAETERVKLVNNLENAVNEANRVRSQLEAVFQAMDDGIALLNMAGDVILLNEAEARINGYATTAEMKRNLAHFAEIFEVTELDGRPVSVDHWPASKCLRGEAITNWELHASRKDTGQEWFFRFSGSPIYDQAGQQTLALIVTRDVTEYKNAENEIRSLNAHLEKRVQERTAELEEANEELEAFSYSVSHDLRAPLRAIDGYSQALLEDYGDRFDEAGRQYLQRLHLGSLRMADLIDNLLRLSRITRTKIQRKAIDLSALAASVLAELQSVEPNRQLATAIQPGLEAEGDPNLLRIALVNLMSNAWKFTSPKPDARIELGCSNDRGERAFYVRDNGVGFDMAYVGKLFGAFQRLHTENEFPGMGIGLAIVQRIVHRHGGRVWAESALNQGSAFYFTIPAPPTNPRT